MSRLTDISSSHVAIGSGRSGESIRRVHIGRNLASWRVDRITEHSTQNKGDKLKCGRHSDERGV